MSDEIAVPEEAVPERAISGRPPSPLIDIDTSSDRDAIDDNPAVVLIF